MLVVVHRQCYFTLCYHEIVGGGVWVDTCKANGGRSNNLFTKQSLVFN